MATQKKKGTSWEDVMNQVQGQANRAGQTATVTVTVVPRRTTTPRDEEYYTNAKPKASQRPNRPASNNVVTYQERPQPGYLAPGQQGPRTRPQAQGSAVVSRPGAGAGYRFTQTQPALAAAAANKIRGQYASIQGGGGGSFVTDTNQGLLELLQRAGITPTPLNQWGQLATRLRR
jgi:hypothetical protein